ncbi:pyridoxamine 5'-phosphate oxidase family protein [Streptomyces avermitilis]|uniref:pyridoxamine 5'-phosphate oxidase family protein n=1 Tax=Streptomyces avermitilis TaxID=33903 RepID=UPI0036B8D962
MPTDEHLAVELIGRADHGRVATSMRALPFLVCVRHIVLAGRVLLRLHGGWGYHRACVGSVVAFGSDNLGRPGPGGNLWSAQIVGRCEAIEPTAAQIALFGPAPSRVDGEPFDPVYLRIEPQLGTVHFMDDHPMADDPMADHSMNDHSVEGLSMDEHPMPVAGTPLRSRP